MFPRYAYPKIPITRTLDSQVRLFPEDTVLYRTIKSDTANRRLQIDLDTLTEQWHGTRKSTLHVQLFTLHHRSAYDRHRKVPGYHHPSIYEVDTIHNTNLFTCQQGTCIHENKCQNAIPSLYNSLVRPLREIISVSDLYEI